MAGDGEVSFVGRERDTDRVVADRHLRPNCQPRGVGEAGSFSIQQGVREIRRITPWHLELELKTTPETPDGSGYLGGDFRLIP